MLRPPAVLSMKGCAGKPVGVCEGDRVPVDDVVCVCDGVRPFEVVCVGVDDGVGVAVEERVRVPDRVRVDEAVTDADWLFDAVVDCDGLGDPLAEEESVSVAFCDPDCDCVCERVCEGVGEQTTL